MHVLPRNLVSVCRGGSFFTLSILLSVAAGCDQQDTADGVEVTSQALADDVTVPRVPNPPLASDLARLAGDLRSVAVPGPDLADFVVDRTAAIALGKALFWDMQVGSDRIQACASCHFNAGADPRSKNQLSPGLKRIPEADLAFTHGGPNSRVTAADFPFTKLAVPDQRGELDPATDTNDIVSSQGVHHLTATREMDPLGYSVGFTNTRRVEPRNTPSVINAVFNHRQFWDGRAENVFNGVNNLGARDPNARVARADDRSAPALVAIALINSSLASQAVAPVVSDLEMAAPGTRMFNVARRLLPARPLARQLVDRTDSVLGSMSRSPRRGLSSSNYSDMIKKAFHRRWWDSDKLARLAPDGTVTFVSSYDGNPATVELTLQEYNFAVFFGLAIQLYEATLVADNTPWDRFRREHPTATDPALNPWVNTAPNHISRLALFGAMLFNDRTRGPTNVRCANCHESTELTDVAVGRINIAVNGPVRNRDGNVIDKGFNNIGFRPTTDDLGVGASDEFGPLSLTRRLFPDAAPAVFDGAPVALGFGVDGAVKIPGLRNVALTAPYYRTGGVLTLRDAVEFYSRGGNVDPITTQAGTLIEGLGVPLLSSLDIDAIVAFLEALTDERVVNRQAPFDHPQLFVPNGHLGNDSYVFDFNRDGRADDAFVEIRAVGASGGPRLPGFLEGVFGSSGH